MEEPHFTLNSTFPIHHFPIERISVGICGAENKGDL